MMVTWGGAHQLTSRRHESDSVMLPDVSGSVGGCCGQFALFALMQVLSLLRKKTFPHCISSAWLHCTCLAVAAFLFCLAGGGGISTRRRHNAALHASAHLFSSLQGQGGQAWLMCPRHVSQQVCPSRPPPPPLPLPAAATRQLRRRSSLQSAALAAMSASGGSRTRLRLRPRSWRLPPAAATQVSSVAGSGGATGARRARRGRCRAGRRQRCRCRRWRRCVGTDKGAVTMSCRSDVATGAGREAQETGRRTSLDGLRQRRRPLRCRRIRHRRRRLRSV